MVIHLLCCVHGSECIGTHDAIRDTLVAITHDASFHMGRKQLHALPSTTFNSSHRQVDIMITKDGIHTLVDVVIANPTRINLLPQSCVTQGFVTFDATQDKERSYCNQHPINQFLPLTIKVFSCLHKHVNAIWSLKGPEGPHLGYFFHQKISITLQRMEASSILSWAVVVGLVTSQFSPLQNTPPSPRLIYRKLSVFDIKNLANLPQVVGYRHGEISHLL
jgi:hypothetical protein